MPLLTQPLYEHGDPDRPGPYPHGRGGAKRGRGKRVAAKAKVLDVRLTTGVTVPMVQSVMGKNVDLYKLTNQMVEDADPNLTFTATWFTRGPHTVWVDIRSTDISTPANTYMTRYFRREPDGTLTAEHSHMEVGEKWRGQGKALLRSHMRAYEQLGVDRITLRANVEVGAYAWARYGFRIADGAHREIGDALLLAVNVLTRPPLTELWHAQLSAGKQHVLSIVERIQQGDQHAIWDIAALRDGDVNIGKHLLMDTSWEAELPLDDALAMKRFRSYVGE